LTCDCANDRFNLEENCCGGKRARHQPPISNAKIHFDGERGLIGLFLCGSLAGQFEQLYSWINTNNFSAVFAPNFDTQDALIANRVSPSNGDPSFTMPLPNGTAIKIPSMPQFLVTRGTAYCLLPSMTTLQGLAGAVA
jgi:hypothetical protein